MIQQFYIGTSIHKAYPMSLLQSRWSRSLQIFDVWQYNRCHLLSCYANSINKN